jgi:hypothetical protein
MEFFTVPNPIFIPMEFAKNGIKNVIQKVRQSGQDAQDMTWNDGTPPITLTKLEDGGFPPKGQDYNGVLNAISSHTVFNQNGGRYKWDPQVVIEFGGYPKDAIVQSSDGTREYISLIDNNQINPDSSTTGTWSIYAGQGSVPLATSTTAGVMRVINNLTSSDVGSALSSAQGKVLNDILDIIAYNPTPYYGNTAPSGFITMSGQTITQAQYPKLFARYGATLPNLNDGSFIRGVGGNAAAMGVKQGDAIRNITGEAPGGSGIRVPASSYTGAFSLSNKPSGRISTGENWDLLTATFDASRVVPTASENRPKNIAFLYIVKAG